MPVNRIYGHCYSHRDVHANTNLVRANETFFHTHASLKCTAYIRGLLTSLASPSQVYIHVRSGWVLTILITYYFWTKHLMLKNLRNTFKAVLMVLNNIEQVLLFHQFRCEFSFLLKHYNLWCNLWYGLWHAKWLVILSLSTMRSRYLSVSVEYISSILLI